MQESDDFNSTVPNEDLEAVEKANDTTCDLLCPEPVLLTASKKSDGFLSLLPLLLELHIKHTQL